MPRRSPVAVLQQFCGSNHRWSRDPQLHDVLLARSMRSKVVYLDYYVHHSDLKITEDYQLRHVCTRLYSNYTKLW